MLKRNHVKANANAMLNAMLKRNQCKNYMPVLIVHNHETHLLIARPQGFLSP